MQTIRFNLSHRYNNYKLLLDYIDEKCVLENNLEYLSTRLKFHYDNLLRIKEKIIHSPYLKINEEIDFDNLFLIIQSLENISNKYKNDSLMLNKTNSLNKEIELLIKDVKSKLKQREINIDLLLGVFKLVSLEKELFEVENSKFKLSTYYLDNKSMHETILNLIYGQSFEDLNKVFLKNFFGKEVYNISSLQYWEYISKKHQYNVFLKDNQNINISFDQFLFNKEIDHKYRINLPSFDLETKLNDTKYYIETKNFTSDQHNDFYFNFAKNPNTILDRFKNLSILGKDNCKLLFNINIYNEMNKEFYSFIIPIEELKKFYSKVDNKLNQFIKQTQRNNSFKHKNNIELNTEIQDQNLILLFDLKNLQISDRFNIKINIKSFCEMFEKYLITNDKSLQFVKDMN